MFVGISADPHRAINKFVSLLHYSFATVLGLPFSPRSLSFSKCTFASRRKLATFDSTVQLVQFVEFVECNSFELPVLKSRRTRRSFLSLSLSHALASKSHGETSNWQRVMEKKTFWKLAGVTVNYHGGETGGKVGRIASALFHLASETAAGYIRERTTGGGEKERERERERRGVVRAATKVSRRLPRPVASWGPRYRYDVDIWRALLLHPHALYALSSLFLCSLHHQPSPKRNQKKKEKTKQRGEGE